MNQSREAHLCGLAAPLPGGQGGQTSGSVRDPGGDVEGIRYSWSGEAYLSAAYPWPLAPALPVRGRRELPQHGLVFLSAGGEQLPVGTERHRVHLAVVVQSVL